MALAKTIHQILNSDSDNNYNFMVNVVQLVLRNNDLKF